MRLKKGESFLLGRSHCPKCKKTIHWLDNIPIISFILLWGRCRHCRKPISWQYPLVEIFTGLIFAAIAAFFFQASDPLSWALTAYYLIVSACLLVVFVYDWKYYEIPMEAIWASLAFSFLFSLYLDVDFFYSNLPGSALGGDFFHIFDLRIYSGILGAILGSFLFFLLAYFSREKWMGMGDGFLALAIGFFLGWPETMLAIFLAFLIGSMYGIAMVIIGKKKLGSQVPFAPFILSGTWIALLGYEKIVNWYFSLF
jgi:prepilin signal peptidase PulO-like enzyme (type II secretory pathway)